MSNYRVVEILGDRAGQVLARFRSDQRGVIAVLFAMLAVIMLGVIGGAVDYGRWQSARSKTLNAMDSAVLAGGRVLQLTGMTSADALAAAQRYYSKNKSSMLDVDSTKFEVTGSEIVGTSTSSVKSSFLNLMGLKTLPVNVSTKAILAAGGTGGSHVEISMMLDTTGSMGGSKMEDLKAAAKDLVEIVVWQDQSKFSSRVALAPFSELANVGAANFNAIAGPDAGKYVVATTEEVVVEVPVEREVCEKKTKIVKVQKWSKKKKKWVTKNKKKKVTECSTVTETETTTETKTTTETINLTDFGNKFTCIKERDTSSRYTDDAPGSNNYFDYFGQPQSDDGDGLLDDDEIASNPEVDVVLNDGSACRTSSIVTPLTNDKNLLRTRIDDMPTSGYTAGHLGTQWAWYTLSPKWSSVWPLQSEPKPYSLISQTNSDGRPKLYKIAILMTDGSYNKKYTGTDSTTQAREICKEMKKEGITVYTVGFAISKNSSPDITMQQCATSSEHYYNASSGEALKQAFRDIALKISDLRLAE